MSERHVLYTGNIEGEFVTADGTTYDVTPQTIECASHAHALEVADLIGQHHERYGHPDMKDEQGRQLPFTYIRPEQMAALAPADGEASASPEAASDMAQSNTETPEV